MNSGHFAGLPGLLYPTAEEVNQFWAHMPPPNLSQPSVAQPFVPVMNSSGSSSLQLPSVPFRPPTVGQGSLMPTHTPAADQILAMALTISPDGRACTIVSQTSMQEEARAVVQQLHKTLAMGALRCSESGNQEVESSYKLSPQLVHCSRTP
jgi:hypothetical protein